MVHFVLLGGGVERNPIFGGAFILLGWFEFIGQILSD